MLKMSSAKLGSSVDSIHYFRVSSSELTKQLDVHFPLSMKNKVKKFWSAYPSSMIPPVLHQCFLNCNTSPITLVFTPQIQSIYKNKRDDFTEVLFCFEPLKFRLKIACHKGAFDSMICYSFWILLLCLLVPH